MLTLIFYSNKSDIGRVNEEELYTYGRCVALSCYQSASDNSHTQSESDEKGSSSKSFKAGERKALRSPRLPCIEPQPLFHEATTGHHTTNQIIALQEHQ